MGRKRKTNSESSTMMCLSQHSVSQDNVLTASQVDTRIDQEALGDTPQTEIHASCVLASGLRSTT